MESIRLDLVPDGAMPELHASQYDKGRRFRLNLLDFGIDYTLDGTEALTIEERKVDGNICVRVVANTFSGKKYVEFTTTEQMCACAGYNLCELHIVKGEDSIGTLNFILNVERSPIEGGLSGSEIENLYAQIDERVDVDVAEIMDDYYKKSETYSSEEIDNALDLKANANDVYDKTEIDEIIENLPKATQYKGTLGNDGTISELPVASAYNDGDAYIVITAGTYSGTTARVGDTFISNGTEWTLIPTGTYGTTYIVGENQTYETINEAVDAWHVDGEKPATIYILNGTYDEKVDLSGRSSNLSFVGESKEGVIWKQTTGYYKDCPLSISGNNLIANITFVADISSNPDYVYTPYVTGDTGAAYALHLDAPNASGVIHVYNCDLYSYVNAAIGCGTCPNRTLIIENCNLTSLGNYATNTNGALLFHGDANNDSTGQKLILKNNKFYHANSPLAIFIQNIGNTLVDVEMLYNTLGSGAYISNDALITANFEKASNGFNLLKTSVGNNVERMNYPDSSWQKHLLTDYQGYPFLETSDLDALRDNTCIWKGNSALGTANTPVTGHAFIGVNICYSSNTYTIQYAWDTMNFYKLYKRTYVVGVGWSSWKSCLETQTEINSNYIVIEADTRTTGATGNVALGYSATNYKLESYGVAGKLSIPFISGGNWFLRVFNDNMTPLASSSVDIYATLRKTQ